MSSRQISSSVVFLHCGSVSPGILQRSQPKRAYCLLANRTALDVALKMPVSITTDVASMPGRLCLGRLVDKFAHRDAALAHYSRTHGPLPPSHEMQRRTWRLAQVHFPPAGFRVVHGGTAARYCVCREGYAYIPGPVLGAAPCITTATAVAAAATTVCAIPMRRRRVVCVRTCDDQRDCRVAAWKGAKQQAIVLGLATRSVTSRIRIECACFELPVWQEEERFLQSGAVARCVAKGGIDALDKEEVLLREV